jgi:hypothetical protein
LENKTDIIGLCGGGLCWPAQMCWNSDENKSEFNAIFLNENKLKGKDIGNPQANGILALHVDHQMFRYR